MTTELLVSDAFYGGKQIATVRVGGNGTISLEVGDRAVTLAADDWPRIYAFIEATRQAMYHPPVGQST